MCKKGKIALTKPEIKNDVLYFAYNNKEPQERKENYYEQEQSKQHQKGI